MEKKILTPVLKVPENLKLDAPLEILEQSSANIKEVSKLWEESYQKVYPSYSIDINDPFNQQSHIICTKNSSNQIVSTARIIIDSPLGFPDDDIYPPEINLLREEGKKLVEVGRCINTDKDLIPKPYFKGIYLLSKALKADAIIMTMKDRNVSLYQKLIGVKCLSPEMKTHNGGKYKMACMYWGLDKTKDRFFKWVGISKEKGGASCT